MEHIFFKLVHLLKYQNGFFSIEEGNYNLISGDENNLITVLNNKIANHIDLSYNEIGEEKVIEFVYKSNKQKVDIN